MKRYTHNGTAVQLSGLALWLAKPRLLLKAYRNAHYAWMVDILTCSLFWAEVRPTLPQILRHSWLDFRCTFSGGHRCVATSFHCEWCGLSMLQLENLPQWARL